MGGLKAAFTSNEGKNLLGQKETKAFAKAKDHSTELLIQMFVDSMQLDYGIEVNVKSK